jgi:hypothetical protein
MSNTLKTSQYISIHRLPLTQLTDEDLTGNSISVEGETFLELIPESKKRHKIRSLFNYDNNERIVLVK